MSIFGKFGIRVTIIWCRCTLLFPHFISNLMFIFQKFCHSRFLGKVGPEIWSSLNQLKFGTGVYCYMPIKILMFVFAKFLSLIFFGKLWSNNMNFFKLTKISLRGALLYTYYSFNAYFFKILSIHIFLANLVPKSKVLQIDQLGQW